MKKLLALLSLCILLTSCASQQKESYLIILSMDGFRWDYPNMTETPNLDSIAKIGVRAEAIRPAFPSKTFPNHYTGYSGILKRKHCYFLEEQGSDLVFPMVTIMYAVYFNHPPWPPGVLASVMMNNRFNENALQYIAEGDTVAVQTNLIILKKT